MSKYQANPSPGHIKPDKYMIKYVKGTKYRESLYSVVRIIIKWNHFYIFQLIPSKLTQFTDKNGGPRDQ